MKRSLCVLTCVPWLWVAVGAWEQAPGAPVGTSAPEHAMADRDASAEAPDVGGPLFRRVKPIDPVLHDLLAGGSRRSATLRDLVDTLEGADWLVFVQRGRCPEKAAVACLLHFVGAFEGAPYLRVVVPLRADHPDTTIALIAHELQHAREVITSGEVVDAAGIRQLFARIGSVSVERADVRTYETAAARQTEETVSRELRRQKAARSR
jgi:hypothetical protein